MGARSVLSRCGSSSRSACLPGSGCGKRYEAGSTDETFLSKLRIAMREKPAKVEEWDPVDMKGNPSSSALVESYLTFASEE